MSKVKLFYDLMSQPARTLWMAMRLSKTPFEDCPVALRKLEQRTEEYRKINRFQKVPCIVDGDFKLSESVAIIRYLADKNLISENLYPKDLKNRSRVDEFLEWHHMNIRLFCGTYFVRCWLLPMNGLAEMPSAKSIEKMRIDMENNFEIVENIWLDKTNYLTGNKLTVADLFGASEILQTKLLNYEVDARFPKTIAWLERVRGETNPIFDEAHKIIYKKAAASAKV